MNAGSVIRHVLAAECCIASLLLATPGTCQAHPASHVDAWARIGTHLDIRVTVFLDNLPDWHDRNSQVDHTVISAANATTALQRFEGALPELLQIRNGDGQRLQPQIQQRPRWKPSDQGVDLRADGALRLAWTLRYPWSSRQRSFTIRHAFLRHRTEESGSTESSPAPCELRLRVRCDATRRRFDTIISDHQPHTIELPDSPAMAVFSGPGPIARLVVLPAQLVHEFSLPLHLAQAAVPSLAPINASDPHIVAAESEAVCRQLQDWAQQNCELTIDGKRSAAHFLTAELLTQDDEQCPDATPVTAGELRIGIRAIHQLHEHPERIIVSWRSGLAETGDIQLDTLSGSHSTSELIGVDDPLGPRSYSWNIPPAADVARVPVSPNRDSGRTAFGADRLWNRARPVLPFRSSLWMVPLIGCLTIVCVRRRVAKPTLAAVGIAFGAAFILIGSLSDTAEPDSAAASTLLTEMLEQVHHAILIPDERAAVSQLSEVLSDDLVESVFRQSSAVMSLSEDNAPFVHITNVRLNDCTLDSYTAPTLAGFQCEWQVEGQVLHWGHRHQRTMLQSGVIEIESHGDGCRISGITVTNNKTQVSSPESDST